eukprot:4681402-Amphidinium_carterae.1
MGSRRAQLHHDTAQTIHPWRTPSATEETSKFLDPLDCSAAAALNAVMLMGGCCQPQQMEHEASACGK